ncbi:hypothetical protein B0H14DRAFT_3454533 [Mycena olivaceomarginata]|nr:hypothetical protein B0H14DRAFT_3454533 [Mycena olivaceomarginata]
MLPTSSSVPYTNPWSPIPNAQNRYSDTYPRSNDPTTLGNVLTGPDLSSYPDTSDPDCAAYSLENDHQYGGSSAHLELLRSGPVQSVQGGTFFTAKNVIIAQNVDRNHGEAGMHILHRAVALEALYDSADSFPQPKCHPETRTEILDGLYNWAIKDGVIESICWLHGPAGAGKSAIMQTLCQKLQNTGRLDGAFFFKRGHTTRGNGKSLFATLAYQVALNNRGLKPLISRTAEDDPSVVARHMDVQLRKLIVGPCQSLANCQPLILLIDGLDECQEEGAQQEIIRLIGSAVHQHPNTFRFLIASRPEADIRDIFEDPSFDGILDFVNVDQSFEDIRTYFVNEFARIHREHRHIMGGVPTPWPSTNILDILVEKSSGYFVYASTVIKFIDDKNFHPEDRLAAVQNLSPAGSDAPFEALDRLYIQILSGVPARFHSKICDILQCVVSKFRTRLTPHQIERLLQLRPGEAHLILRGLHSIVKIDSFGLISVHHASFLDFLQDRQRSSVFHIKPENRMNVTCAVLKALSDDNRWINNVDDSYVWCFADWLDALLPFHRRRSLYPVFDLSIQIYSGGVVTT